MHARTLAQRADKHARAHTHTHAGHVFMSLEPHFFDTGNVIYKARDKGEEMYFMIKGEAQLDLLQSRVIADGLSQTLRCVSSWLCAFRDITQVCLCLLKCIVLNFGL